MPADLTVENHYTREGLAEAILEAARTAGLDTERLSPDELAAVDEFHTRGRLATEELAELAQPKLGQRVLDVGCGLGGTARYLAARHGVQVRGIDLTAAFCRAGNVLSERTGLADRVELITADALDLPFPEDSFDLAWTEHVTMNIADKHRLYRELRRVLRPDGRLAFHEIVAGPAGAVHFPVPWAQRREISFLATPAELRRAVEQAGLRVTTWRDVTAPAVRWFRERAAAAAGAAGTPALGLHLLLGPAAGAMFANQVRNLEEDRIRVVQAIAEAAS
jgi:SAM-dependent methyltransferase